MSSEEIIDSALARYERALISFARAITGDPESARDAVQETFLRLSRQGFVGPRVALDLSVLGFGTGNLKDSTMEKAFDQRETKPNECSCFAQKTVGERAI